MIHNHSNSLTCRTAGSSHLLMGHSEAVLTAAWSPTQEHLLATVRPDNDTNHISL